MGLKTLFSFALGVTVLGIASCDDQSGETLPGEEPMGSLDSNIDKRRIETPQVVLQLKYNGGELNRIYLAQFRKEAKPWAPSVPSRTNLCTDLCQAGLGGEACGAPCQELIPVGLQTALSSANDTDAVYGEPRYAVCPTLCHNKLGDPLCNCGAMAADAGTSSVDWSAICTAFCEADRYVLGGCPTCEQTTTPLAKLALSRVLATSEGWAAWCNVQCRQGQGGAACNCDRTPFQ